MADSKALIIKAIKKQRAVQATKLAAELGISRQALHRHLRALEAAGKIVRDGDPPLVRYRLAPRPVVGPVTADEVVRDAGKIFAALPGVLLVTLFGSQARGSATEHSDVDLLVWTTAGGGPSRRKIWDFWDRDSTHLRWSPRASLVTMTFSSPLMLHTLLLDLPEEHLVVYDPKQIFPKLKRAVQRWRRKNRAVKVHSFGEAHSWVYSPTAASLADIDFRLELDDVA